MQWRSAVSLLLGAAVDSFTVHAGGRRPPLGRPARGVFAGLVRADAECGGAERRDPTDEDQR